MSEPAAEHTTAARAPGHKVLGMSQRQLLIVGGIALAGIGWLLWKRHQAQAASSGTGTAAAAGSGDGAGTCPDGSTVDCSGLCPDGSVPQGCPDYSGQLSTLQSEIGNLQSALGQGAGGGGVVTTGGGDGSGTPVSTGPTGTGTTGTTGTGTGGGGGSWSYPAPGGLTAFNVSKTGYSIKWDKVTGPGGQKPATYTVATYNAKGQEVDQFISGSTSTKEYGKGGTGLKAGTYHTNVWANGGPKAPPHATVQVTITGK